jgi:hypothetical protein
MQMCQVRELDKTVPFPPVFGCKWEKDFYVGEIQKRSVG